MNNYIQRGVPFGESRQHVNKTQSQLNRIFEIDSRTLSDSLTGWVVSKGRFGGWNGKCPLCSVFKSKHRSREKNYMPAYLYPGNHNGYQEGFIFHCCACETTLTTYQFLQEVLGISTAEKYAQERWDAGQLCGRGWNCPLPSKEYRRESYRRADQERKTRNYHRKYGSSSTESA